MFLTVIFLSLFACEEKATDAQGVAFNVAMILRKDIDVDQLSSDHVKEQLIRYFQADTLMESERREFYINELMKVDSLEKVTINAGTYLKLRIGASCYYINKERATQCEVVESM